MTKQKFNSTIQTILVTVFSFLFVTMISYATTIGTNISTGGTLAVTGTTTLANASTTQLSVSNNLYTALTANSIPYITTSGLLTQDTSNLVWDSTNNRMGIGTSSPYAKLSIHANNGETNTTLFNIASSTASATTSLFTVLNNGNVEVGSGQMLLSSGSLSAPSISFSSDSDTGFYSGGSGRISFSSNGNSRGYWDSTKIGIPDILAWNNDSSVRIYRSANDTLSFQTNGSDNVTINPSGYIGIGTSSPATLMDVYSTATTTVTWDSSSATQGACIKIKDMDGGGYTYLTVLNGAGTFSSISCEN